MSKYGSHGTLLKMGDGSASPTYTTIAQVVDGSGPGISRGVTPTPTHDDTGGLDKIADGLYDGGQVTLTIEYDPAGATHDATTGLMSVMQSGALRGFQRQQARLHAFTIRPPHLQKGQPIRAHRIRRGAARSTRPTGRP